MALIISALDLLVSFRLSSNLVNSEVLLSAPHFQVQAQHSQRTSGTFPAELQFNTEQAWHIVSIGNLSSFQRPCLWFFSVLCPP